jgi:hypothetical protein
MFLNTKSAYKSAEDYYGKQQEKQQVARAKPDRWSSGSNSCDTVNIIGREDVPIRSGLTWLAERNKKLKSEAIAMLQDTIVTQEKRKRRFSNLIKLTAQMGLARMELSSNQKGVYAVCPANLPLSAKRPCEKASRLASSGLSTFLSLLNFLAHLSPSLFQVLSCP